MKDPWQKIHWNLGNKTDVGPNAANDKSTHPSTLSGTWESKVSESKLRRDVRCVSYRGLEHMPIQCPNKMLIFWAKLNLWLRMVILCGENGKEIVYCAKNPTAIMTMLGSDAEEQAHCEVIRPFLPTQKGIWKRTLSAFKQSSCAADNCALSLLIGGSCIYVVSEYVTKLGFKSRAWSRVLSSCVGEQYEFEVQEK